LTESLVENMGMGKYIVLYRMIA